MAELDLEQPLGTTTLGAVRLAAARAAHEANLAYCNALGDTSQVPWELAPGWAVESALLGAGAILANPDTTPEQSHDGWLAQKVKDGWVLGPVKDATLKQHPCMVAYADLPPEQRAKDSIFGSVVRAMYDALAPGWRG